MGSTETTKTVFLSLGSEQTHCSCCLFVFKWDLKQVFYAYVAGWIL